MLISEPYRALQAALHASDPRYGVASLRYAPQVAMAMSTVGVREVLDYGAGKQRLRDALRAIIPDVVVYAYEPSDPNLCHAPSPCMFVACIDVLEHVEPAFIHNVLDDLRRVTIGHGFFTVATRPASKVLADGRNAHLIQQPLAWWSPLLDARFKVLRLQADGGGFTAYVAALP